MKILNAIKALVEIIGEGPKAGMHRHKIALRTGRFLLNTLVHSDDNPHQKFELAEAFSSLIYPEYKFSEFGRTFMEDIHLLANYSKFNENNNWHSLDRKFFLKELLKLTDSVDGETAECGVFNGASSFFICQHNQGKSKKHHLFDSFEGLSQPHAIDGTHWQANDLSCPEEKVKTNLNGFEFIVFHKGWIPFKFIDVRDTSFSFVHIDVDLYEPTLCSLDFFYNHLTSGGIILCDDYGFNTCPGAQMAMDEFFKDKSEAIIQSPTGQAFVIKH